MNQKNNSLQTNMKKATIEMLLLKLLSEQDMYGYQITQEFKKRSNGAYTLKEGSMYPILYRLTDSQFISSYEKDVGKRQTRKYYHLESAGITYLEELRIAYEEYTDLVSFLLNSQSDDTFPSTKNE